MAALAAVGPPAQAAQPAARWEQWAPVPGAFDVVGPRTDGRLVVAGAGRLVLLDPATGRSEPFGDYRTDAAFENYVALSPGIDVPGAGCRFERDEVYAVELTAPVRIVRIDATGRPAPFVTPTGVEFLSGITFDTVGTFGRRLLTTATRAGRTTVLAVDCRGQVTIIGEGPLVEGGIEVAPTTFGRLGGALIGADEHSGDLVAFRPDGTSEVFFHPDLPFGADIGVESLGFVPPGFFPDGALVVADRISPGAPTLGTDTVLRLTGPALSAAGVREGDLVVSTEAVGRTVAVRCPAGTAPCTATFIAEATAAAHPEGHVTAVVPRRAAPAATSTTTVSAGTGTEAPDGDDGVGASLAVAAALAGVGLVIGILVAVSVARRRAR